MPTRLDLFRSSALLRRSETQPEEKFVHRTLLSTSYHRQGAADDGHRRLLRARPERPRHCRGAKQRDEGAPLHSITSSARASRLSGTVRPSSFAVLRLITSSYFVGACTGRSAGFSPLRMRST